jgi:hypothetical protein
MEAVEIGCSLPQCLASYTSASPHANEHSSSRAKGQAGRASAISVGCDPRLKADQGLRVRRWAREDRIG